MGDVGGSNISSGVVMIAMDGSEHSFYAFDWYMDFLYKPGQTIIVAHCPDYKSILRTPVMSTDSSVMSRMIQQSEAEVDKILTQIKGKLSSAKHMEAKLLRLSGEAGSSIVKAADEYKATCIVTGSRGLGSVRRTLVGSVSNYILHHAHCPVLVCQPKHPGCDKP